MLDIEIFSEAKTIGYQLYRKLQNVNSGHVSNNIDVQQQTSVQHFVNKISDHGHKSDIFSTFHSD